MFVLIVGAVYGNTFLNQWTYDDLPVVVNNPDAHSLTGFLENHRPGRPLRELSYIPDYMVFGGKPAGYHVQQLLWHLGCGSLLFVLFGLLGLRPVFAAIAALLFLVHPLQSETVANISHRKEILALFFSLSSFYAYSSLLRRSDALRWLLAVLAPACYLLAVSANETALVLPLLFPVYEILFVPRQKRLLLKYPLLFGVAATGAFVGLVRHYSWMFDPDLLLRNYSKNSFVASRSYFPLWMADLKSFLFYLYKIVLPINLAPEYNVKFSLDLIQPWSLIGAFALCLLLYLVVALRKKEPLVSFGISWFVVFYLPVSNILPISYMLADRYMYLCLPGIAMAAGALLQKADSFRLTVVFCVIIAVLSILTVRQNSFWRDEDTLWRHAVKVNPDSTWVQETVALSYLLSDEFEKAREHAREALRLNRYNVRAYLTLAKSEDRLGNLQSALENYKLFVKFGVFEYSQEVETVATYIPFLEKRIARGSNGIDVKQ